MLCQLLIDVDPLVSLWGLDRTIARLLDLSNKDLRTVACRLVSSGLTRLWRCNSVVARGGAKDMEGSFA